MNQPQHSELFTEAVSTLRNYPEDASSAALERITDALIDLEGEDVSERSFKDRLLDSPKLWEGHCCEAVMPSSEATISLLASIRLCRRYSAESDRVMEKAGFEAIGREIYANVMGYAEVLGNE